MNTSAKARFMVSQGWWMNLSGRKACYMFDIHTVKQVSAYSRVHEHPSHGFCKIWPESYVNKLTSMLVRAEHTKWRIVILLTMWSMHVFLIVGSPLLHAELHSKRRNQAAQHLCNNWIVIRSYLDHILLAVWQGPQVKDLRFQVVASFHIRQDLFQLIVFPCFRVAYVAEIKVNEMPHIVGRLTSFKPCVSMFQVLLKRNYTVVDVGHAHQ